MIHNNINNIYFSTKFLQFIIYNYEEKIYRNLGN